MAKNVNIKLGANISDFESKMKRAQKGFKRTATNLKRIGKSMSLSLTAPLTAFAAASLDAFDKQAKAEAQLRTALQGNKDAFESLTTAAQEFQEQTLFSNDDIIAQQAYLASLGLTESKINDVIRASMDLAAGTGQTLAFGVKNLAKTFSGLTGELGESIPALKNLTTEQLKAGEAVDVVAEAFNGQAKAAAEAGLGGVQQLKNSVGDLAKELGKALMPMVNDLTDRVKVLVDGFKTLTAAQMEMKVKIAAWTAAIGPLLVGLSAVMTAVQKLGGGLKWLARTIIVPVVIVAINLLISTLAVAIAAFGGWVVAGVALLAAAFTSLAHTFLTANDELVKFNAAQAECIVLTKEQAEATDNLIIPFTNSIGSATARVRELKIALEEVSQITAVDNDDGLAGGLIRVNYTLEETKEGMSQLGYTAMNTFSMIADRVLQFRGTFGQVLEELGIMLGKMILKAAIMAAVLSALSGGVGGAGILGVGKGLSFGEAFGQTLGITGRASGGSVVAGQPYVVGESGAEMFIPNQSGTIIPNNNLGGGGIPDVKISGEDLIIVFDRAKRHRNALG